MLWEFSEDSGHHRQMFQVIMSLEQRVALKQKIVMNKYEKTSNCSNFELIIC